MLAPAVALLLTQDKDRTLRVGSRHDVIRNPNGLMLGFII